MKNLILILPLILLTACNDALEVNNSEEVNTFQGQDNDYFIFGTEYGFCIGDCIHLFKIQGGKLYADNLSKAQFGKDEFTFQAKPLDQKYYEMVKDLPKKLNQDLLQSEGGRYGSPDAHDQGGVYIGIKQGSTEKLWFADPVTERIPENMRDLVKKIVDVTQQILQEQQNG